MSHWAVVVGINDYAMPKASLSGAVRDALRVCSWLLDPKGGAVPRHQLFVGLNPPAPLPALGAPDDAMVANLRPVACPNKDAIVDLFHTLVQKSGGEGDRLYVYFAGHGLQFPSGQGVDSAIVAADVDGLHPDRSLSVTSILEYFEATRFLDQFFFIDACRNVPWKGKFRAGQVSVGPPCDPPVASPQQFVCLATSEGSVAVESQEGGAFTDALIRGLAGQDDAKIYDPETDRFLVSWNKLFTFVCDEVKRAQRTLPNGTSFVQIPRDEKSKRGANRSADPLLWTIDAASATFPPVELSVTVDPATAAPVCAIRVQSLYDPTAEAQVFGPSTSVPRSIPLQPNWYRLYPEAPGFRHRQPRGVAVGLMGARDIPLHLDPLAPQTATRGLGMPDPNWRSPASEVIGGALEPAEQAARDAKDGLLKVDPGDPLMAWEVVTASGEVASYTGKRELPLKAGVYTVRSTTPEGVKIEQLIDLAGSETETARVALPRPSDAVEQIGQTAGFQFIRDAPQRIELSEAFAGGVANVQLSTVLALAATAQILGPDSGYGYKLRQVNLAPMDAQRLGGKPAVVAVFGAEERSGEPGPAPAQEIGAVRTGWKHGGAPMPAAEPLDHRSSSPAIGQWIAQPVPGHGELIVAAPGRSPVSFSLYLPADRVLVVVVHRLPNGDVGVYVHTVRYDDAPAQTLRQVRLLDLSQRYMLRGRFDYPSEPQQLIAERPDDPIALLLAAYAWQRRGEHGRAADIADSLLSRYPDWSDPLLIRAEALAHSNEPGARDAYIRVLDAGPPSFAGGLARLWQSVLRLDLQHPTRERLAMLVSHRVAGVLWTAEELTARATAQAVR